MEPCLPPTSVRVESKNLMLIGFCILTQTLSTPYDHNPVQGCLDTLILLGDPQQLMYPGAEVQKSELGGVMLQV